jgi:hypothetical protein
MHVAPTLIARALDRARAEWLAGDPEAWQRYTDGLARLERHLAAVAASRPAAPRPSMPDRPAVRR